MSWGNFPKVIAAAVVIAWLTAGFVISQDTDPYVRKTGSTSTGTQTFGGTNGQIVLPPTYQPPISASGKIYNDPTLGLMIFKGGVWQQVGRTDGITGVSVQFGTSSSNTVTALRFTTALTGSTAGATSTVQVDLGTGSGQAMPGNQSLSGDVTGTVGATALSGSVNVSTTGTIKSSGGTSILDQTAYSPVSTDGNKKLVATDGPGTAGQVWTSQGPSSTGHWADNASGVYQGTGAAYDNITISNATSLQTIISAHTVEMKDVSGNVSLCALAQDTTMLTATAAGGLDTGTVTVDKIYTTWQAKHKTAGTQISLFSLGETIGAVTWPTGWTDAWYRRIGSFCTKHTAVQIVDYIQNDMEYGFRNPNNVATSLDGNEILTNGAATTLTQVIVTTRLLGRASVWYFMAEMQPNTTETTGSLILSDISSSGNDRQYAVGRTASAASVWDLSWGPVPWWNKTGSLYYKNGQSSNRSWIYAMGWRDRPGGY